VPYRAALEGLAQRARSPVARARYLAELETPAFPAALGYLWQAYLRLARRRGSGASGANPIAFTEIEAFQRLTGQRLAPWEVALIEELDDMQRAEFARAREEGSDDE